MVKNLKDTPQKPSSGMMSEDEEAAIEIPEGREEEKEETHSQEDARPRRTMITDKELAQFGYTPGCPGCTSRRQGRVAKKGHSETCHRRIEKAMEETIEGKKRLEQSKARMTEAIAKELERGGEARRETTGRTDAEEASRMATGRPSASGEPRVRPAERDAHTEDAQGASRMATGQPKAFEGVNEDEALGLSKLEGKARTTTGQQTEGIEGPVAWRLVNRKHLREQPSKKWTSQSCTNLKK